jgi:hypothetical protein
MALRAILDQTHAVRTGDVTECTEFSGLATEVHGQYRCRPSRKRRPEARESSYGAIVCVPGSTSLSTLRSHLRVG